MERKYFKPPANLQDCYDRVKVLQKLCRQYSDNIIDLGKMAEELARDIEYMADTMQMQLEEKTVEELTKMYKNDN